jgi:hypothetical protein
MHAICFLTSGAGAKFAGAGVFFVPDQALRYFFSLSTISSLSHGKSRSGLPKWPYAAVLSINRVSQPQMGYDFRGPQIEFPADDLSYLLVGQFSGTLRTDKHGYGTRDAYCVGDLYLASFRKA